MAMHEVYLEKDKQTIQGGKASEENQRRLIEEWHGEEPIESQTPTRISTLKGRIAEFNRVREGVGLNSMFVVATFRSSVVEKILTQTDTYGLRLYLSINEDNGSFEPILVAVNDTFEDILADDDKLEKAFFCGTYSKCPPPEPTSACPQSLLLLPDPLLSII